MTNILDTVLKKPKGKIAQYLKIPRDIVRDNGYPFDKESELQIVTVCIDYENKTLIIKQKDGE